MDDGRGLLNRSRMTAMAAVWLLVAGCSAEPPARPAAPAPSAVAVSQEGLTTVTGKAPRGAVVALESADTAASTPPLEPIVMDQRGQQFLPALLVARVGQPVEFRNGETISHNVYVTRSPGGQEVFNVSTDPNQAYTHVFERAGHYDVSCDIHPSMRASLLLVTTPHVTVADDFGAFTIMNVPPGGYRLVGSLGNRSGERRVDIKGAHVDAGTVMVEPS